MRAKLWCLGALGLTFGGPALAADWARDLEDVRRACGEVRSVYAGFVQTKSMRLLKKPLRSEGVFVFEAPGSVRWEYQSPLRSVLLVERGKLQRFSQRDGAWLADAAERLEAMRVVVEELQTWMTGRFADSQAFSPTFEPAAEGRPARIVLSPREAGLRAIIQRVELEFGARPGLVQRIRIVEGPEAETSIEFQDVRLNEPVEPGLFREPGSGS